MLERATLKVYLCSSSVYFISEIHNTDPDPDMLPLLPLIPH